eukprot:CAMPEP_0184301192 /NCGR_PEP_ID=MMETSP1049-20130417/11447_1 /TAXON_ID=77928 /ORGANISM="Proteomonas sulcata, Strain CCMP704" /LENGTH=70 /DNA_ID=CAMNT_0026612119 /DNA_START=472 /DNA_END=684 /DNA_ORIENTATION=-
MTLSAPGTWSAVSLSRPAPALAPLAPLPREPLGVLARSESEELRILELKVLRTASITSDAAAWPGRCTWT